MSKLKIEVTNYNLAPDYAGQIWAGNAFAFVSPTAPEVGLQTELANFYGIPVTLSRRVVPLLPDGQNFPGFKVQPTSRPFKLAPVLLTDKEIYRAGEDAVRLLVAAPGWIFSDASAENRARIVIEHNGVNFRSQNVTLADGGLTLVELGKLPEGRYRVYWESNEITDYAGDKAECRFSSVAYVLSPLQATLLAHELRDQKLLACRLKVERFNEPLNEPVQIELWSGNAKLGQERVKPSTPGIFNISFKLKGEATERLELRVSHLDQLATVVIPGSRKAERDETPLSKLGHEVTVSLMPGANAREIRGLYLNDSDMVMNTPVLLDNPAPADRKAKIRWQVAAEAARLLILDFRGAVVADKDLGAVKAGQEFEVEVPTPGGFLAVGGWLGEKAWEGWSALLTPTTSQVKIEAPATARPGKEVSLKLTANGPASVYLLVRDTRLAGSGPQERLAASIKQGLEGLNKWGTNGYVAQRLTEHPDWPQPDYYNRPGGYRLARFGDEEITGEYVRGITMPLPPPSAPPMGGMARPVMMAAPMPTAAPRPQARMAAMAASVPFSFDQAETVAPPQQAGPDPRRDFADVAYCAVVQTDTLGQANISFKLPDAITSYGIEAFALSGDGAEWSAARESLEVSQPVWAEFTLPVFVYPGDKAPASLEAGCNGGQFRLRLTCDGVPVAFTLSGAKQVGPDTFTGNRVKLVFEAQPGLWRVEMEDLTTDERDISERTVEAIGHFKGLARRFQLLTAGETISRSSTGAVQFRLLPSLDKPFKVMCDATANYSHKCCEQTAAKLIAVVAALLAGGDELKLREVILTGVAREKTMHIPGRGFMMYPPAESGGNTSPNDYWGKRAAEHLIGLALIGQALLATNLDNAIKQALREAMAMGEDSARAYGLSVVPTKIENGRDAYRAVMSKSEAQGKALAYARDTLQSYADKNAKPGQGAVLDREEQAYCAATLLGGNDRANLGLAIGAVNNLAQSLDGEGRLYSTVDSTAMISLMVALRSAGIGVGGSSAAQVKLDGREVALSEAIELAEAGQSEEVTVVSGAALVELTSEIVEDWNSFRAEIAVGVQLARSSKINLRPVRVGDSLELVVKIERYEPGLLVHVCLPPALSRIEGGGEVKKFSVDFSGRTEVRVPLRATGATLPAGEHWAVLVRNMFKEEQAGNPGVQLIKVAAD